MRSPTECQGSFARRACATVLVCGALLCADSASGEGLQIVNAVIAPRDAKTATITFDIAWSNSWRHGGFHDAVWVFFKAEDVIPLRSRTFLPTFNNDPWRGPEDVSAKLFLAHDGELLCVAVEVTDDRHCNTQTGDMLWNGDALQINLVNAQGSNWSLALALTANGVVLHPFACPSHDLLKAAVRAVVRDDKTRTTRYELGLPLAILGAAAGEDFALNLMIVDGDDDKGMRAALALHPSMEYPPLIDRFPKFTVR